MATLQEILEELANTPEFLDEGPDEASIQAELLGLSLDNLRGGFSATPEQIALIEAAGGAALNRGLTDIERFETEGFRGLREELAPGLGLRPSDTPILDRGGQLAAEALRQRGNLAETIRGGEFGARLNFPLQAGAQLQAGVLGQQGFGLALQSFQEQLRQQAFQNRFNVFSRQGGLGVNLATGASPVELTFPRGKTVTESGGLGGFTNLLGGIGGFLSGGAESGLFSLFSSRDLKTDKVPIDEDKVLEKIEELPIEAWRYKPGLGLGDRTHVGGYAEDFQRGLGLGDGKTLDLVDTTGVLMASVKALSKKVKRLEGLGLAESARAA